MKAALDSYCLGLLSLKSNVKRSKQKSIIRSFALFWSRNMQLQTRNCYAHCLKFVHLQNFIWIIDTNYNLKTIERAIGFLKLFCRR